MCCCFATKINLQHSLKDTLNWDSSNYTSFLIDPSNNLTSKAASLRDNKQLAKINSDSTSSKDNNHIDFDDKLTQDEQELENEDEDEEDENDEDEEEEEFYKSNPVGSLYFTLTNDDIGDEQERGKIRNKSLNLSNNYNDFDDFEALDLNSFYEPEAKSTIQRQNKNKKFTKSKKFRKKKKKKKEGKILFGSEAKGSKFKNNYKTSSSSGSGSSIVNPMALGNQCAMSLSASANSNCLTYNMIEWAIRRARKLLAGQMQFDDSSTIVQAPSELTINSIGEFIELTTRLIAFKFHLTTEEIVYGLEQIDIRRTSLWRICPRFFRVAAAATTTTSQQQNNECLQTTRYRTHSGRCNNLLSTNLGSASMPFVRMLEPAYADSIGLPRGSGGTLPPARLVSLTLHSGAPDSPSADHSALFANWGQLINHDLASASSGRDSTGHSGSCCKLSASGRLSAANALGLSPESTPLSRICLPIELAADDPVYGPHKMRCHEFKRSIAALRPGCSLGARSQVNMVTSFIDASFVYGSTEQQARSLRSKSKRGQLKTWNYFNRRNRSNVALKPLLPPQVDEPDEECVGRRANLYCFRSGDLRTNQHLPLVVLHTLHTRQHNRLAQALAHLNPHWNSDRVYHEARHIHIALIQHIVLNEYLPLLLGNNYLEKFNLFESTSSSSSPIYWDHYDPRINPGVSQEFAAAAFRQGHSSVPSLVFRLKSPTFNLQQQQQQRLRGRGRDRVYLLRQLFRQPWPLYEPWAMDEFTTGLLETPAQLIDQFVNNELIGHLLQEPNEQVGLDLIAINIQRGRDQGVADYNSFRDWCGLGRFFNFEQLKQVMSNRSSELLESLYNSIDDIDLFSAGLSEFPLEGAQVGPTFACIIARQFQILRMGDRFWYESSLGAHAFSPQQLHSIKQVTLARLICANSDRFDLSPHSETVQIFAMRLPHPILNPKVPCSSLPDVDILAWQEVRPNRANTNSGATEDDDDDGD